MRKFKVCYLLEFEGTGHALVGPNKSYLEREIEDALRIGVDSILSVEGKRGDEIRLSVRIASVDCTNLDQKKIKKALANATFEIYESKD